MVLVRKAILYDPNKFETVDGRLTIKTGAITADNIANGAITSTKIANGAIGTAHIADGAITGAKISSGAIGTTHIANGAVTSTKIANGAIGTNHIADGAVTEEKTTGLAVNPLIQDISATSVTVSAGGETSVFTINGKGKATIVFDGNGDDRLYVRVYVDGNKEDEFPANEEQTGVYAFNTSVEIKVYNPDTANSVTGNHPSMHIRAIAR